MIEQFTVKNYKSVLDASIQLTRFTVLIGENGAGKSNILEALVVAAAAASDKLDLEYLGARGVRLAGSRLMKSAFNSSTKLKPIVINICASNPMHEDENRVYKFILHYDDNTGAGRWAIDPKSDFPLFSQDLASKELLKQTQKDPQADRELKNLMKQMKEFIQASNQKNAKGDEHKLQFPLNNIIIRKLFGNYMGKFSFERFTVYAPTYEVLRNPNSEAQTLPIGSHGEGLLPALSALQENNPDRFKDITDSLDLFGWYKAIKVPTKAQMKKELPQLLVSDRYVRAKGLEISSSSVNEGFLYVLFYLTIFCSPDTPQTFAIENIDTALNPRLCEVLIKQLIKLGEKYSKQAIVTTHNPAALDAIDLNNKNQSLVVVRRNSEGHTLASAYKKPVAAPESKTKLSEAFLRGHIGALPKGI
ncbi:MAG: hypothetical protein EOP81_14265 [Variovorax sp.]|nr:MAG: hypothetical protein EOP81_14265 [Variovorax sp.]